MLFPCNQFGGQETKEGDQLKQSIFELLRIEQMCNSGFKIFQKKHVTGPEAIELFDYLENKDPLGYNDIKWNFTKFLISRDGYLFKRFSTMQEPMTMEEDIKYLIHN